MQKAGIKTLIIAILFTAIFANFAYGQEPILLTIDATKVESKIDEKIYGHFLEHIYHSVNGGLWGELVWNRSFEELQGGAMGKWTIEGDIIEQSMIADNVRLIFGDKNWGDYEYTLEAKKTDGAEGFLILFRVLNDEEFYWCNVAGWSNTQSALEKGAKQRRWGVIGPSVAGGIEANKWYRIRLRCEGAHFQVWLDDKQLLDFTDKDNPHLKGSVGIGTWNTKAQYRNIRIKSLDGKTLFEGLPKPEKTQILARYWNPYGNGQIDISKENPLNSNQCQMIKSDGGEAGIEQQRFCFRKGETYEGSLWARGEALDGLVVRFLDRDKTIIEIALEKPDAQWKKYQLNFKPNVDSKEGKVQIGIKGKGTIWLDQVSLMAQSAKEVGGCRPDLLKAVEELKPPIIRWPGGCFASLYLWKDGIGPQHKRFKYPAYMWDDQDVSSYGTDEFLRMCEVLDIEPIIVINTGRTDSACGGTAQFKLPSQNDYLPYALDWMEYCNGDANTTTWGAMRAVNGHPAPYNVKYWEIDNETWHMGVSTYCDVVDEFAPAMQIKAKELEVPIIILACGSGGFNHKWNRQLIDRCGELIDYLSIHHYENPDRYAKGPYNYENFIKETAEYIKKSKNPDMKIYCSEWNAQSTDWRTGLYAGGVLNAFERCAPTFEIGGPALFLRHVSATAWDNAFINFDHCGWFGAPNYVVMKLWRQHFAPYRIAIEGKSSPLNVVATKSQDGTKIYIKVVNPTNMVVVVESLIENFTPQKAAMQFVAPGSLNARNTLQTPNAIQPVKGEVELSGQKIKFTLPALSAAVVTVEGK